MSDKYTQIIEFVKKVDIFQNQSDLICGEVYQLDDFLCEITGFGMHQGQNAQHHFIADNRQSQRRARSIWLIGEV